MKKAFLTAIFLFLIIFNVSFAEADEITMLDNGIKFVTIDRPYTNTLSVVFFVKGGVTRETDKNNGVGSLFSSVWVKSSELLRELEFYGGSVNANIAHDFFEGSFNIPVEHFSKLVDEYRKLIVQPKFSEDVFEREQKFQLQQISAANDNPQARAYKEFNRATYSGTPYALSTSGTEESVSSIEYAQMQEYYDNVFHGADITVAVSGKISDEIITALKQIFSKLDKGTPYSVTCSDMGINEAQHIEEEDPKTQQAKLFVGYAAPSAGAEDYHVVKTMNDLLGGGMSSRYFRELRKNRGYAYSVGTFYPSRFCKSRLISFIGLDYENVDDALKAMNEINTSLAESLTEDELEKIKNYIVGKILIESQTNQRLSWYACFFENLGLGADYLERYVEKIRSVSIQDIKKASEIFEGSKTVYVLK